MTRKQAFLALIKMFLASFQASKLSIFEVCVCVCWEGGGGGGGQKMDIRYKEIPRNIGLVLTPNCVRYWSHFFR